MTWCSFNSEQTIKVVNHISGKLAERIKDPNCTNFDPIQFMRDFYKLRIESKETVENALMHTAYVPGTIIVLMGKDKIIRAKIEPIYDQIINLLSEVNRDRKFLIKILNQNYIYERAPFSLNEPMFNIFSFTKFVEQEEQRSEDANLLKGNLEERTAKFDLKLSAIRINVENFEKYLNQYNSETVRKMILGGVELNFFTNLGLTPLHIAVLNGDLAIIELLINYHANIEAEDKNYGLTPLHYSICLRQEHITKLLIDNGANINAKDKANDTPLHYASMNGLKSIVKQLIKLGADVNAKDSQGVTPWYLANYCKHDNTARIIINHGGLAKYGKLADLEVISPLFGIFPWDLKTPQKANNYPAILEKARKLTSQNTN